MAEETLLEIPGVKVTTARAMLGGNTYVMAQVTSVRVTTIPANRLPGLILILASITVTLCCASSDISMLVALGGAIGLVIGLVVVFTAKPTYAVRIGMSGGEQQAMVTTEEGVASTVREALEDAIVRRG